MATYPDFSRQTHSHASADQEVTAGGLLTRLLNDVTALFRNEVSLAKREIGLAVGDAKRGLGAVALAGALALGGYLALLTAAILGLATIMAPWLAALIVGIAASLIGLALLKWAQKKLDPAHFKLDRTQESVRRDVAAVRRNL